LWVWEFSQIYKVGTVKDRDELFGFEVRRLKGTVTVMQSVMVMQAL